LLTEGAIYSFISHYIRQIQQDNSSRFPVSGGVLSSSFLSPFSLLISQ
jgi:hypothetical protein